MGTENLSNSASFLPNLLSYLAGFATAIFAEPIRQMIFKPDLQVGFGQSQDYLSHTPEIFNNMEMEAYYIRVRVTNKSRYIAKDCRAYLINIEKKNENDKFSPTIYCDSIQLAWSCQAKGEQYRAIDIAKDVNQYIDVIVTRSITDEFDSPILVKPFRYFSLFREKGIFRVTIQVAASGVSPETIKLVFEWKGDWKNFKVYVEN